MLLTLHRIHCNKLSEPTIITAYMGTFLDILSLPCLEPAGVEAASRPQLPREFTAEQLRPIPGAVIWLIRVRALL